MTDEQALDCGPDMEEAPGWVVLDPDGNVVDSGTVTQLEAVASAGEGEQE